MVAVTNAEPHATSRETQEHHGSFAAEPDLIAAVAIGKPSGDIWDVHLDPRPKTSGGECASSRTPMSASASTPSPGILLNGAERYLGSGDVAARDIHTAPGGSRRRRGAQGYSELSPVGQAKHSVKLPVGQGKLYTRFYRDPGVMDYVGSVVLFLLARARVLSVPGASELRCWCCGCSSGEEVYSVRMLWTQLISAHFPALSLAVHGTDVSTPQLAIARAGVYSASGMGTLPRGWFDACFRPTVSKNAPDADVEVVCPAATLCARETGIGREAWVGLSVMASRYASDKTRAAFREWGPGHVYALLEGGLKCKVAHEAGEYGIYSTGKNKEFDLSPTSLTVTDQIQRGVSFAHQDVREGLPEGPFDLILSRYSTFLYLTSSEAWTALTEIAQALAPGGFLVIGEREMLPQAHVTLGLVQSSECPSVYQKRFDPLASDAVSRPWPLSSSSSASPSSTMLKSPTSMMLTSPLASRPNTSCGFSSANRPSPDVADQQRRLPSRPNTSSLPLRTARTPKGPPFPTPPEPRRTQSVSRLAQNGDSPLADARFSTRLRPSMSPAAALTRSSTAPQLGPSISGLAPLPRSNSTAPKRAWQETPVPTPAPASVHAPASPSQDSASGLPQHPSGDSGPSEAAARVSGGNAAQPPPERPVPCAPSAPDCAPSVPAHAPRSASEMPRADRSSGHAAGHADRGSGHAVGDAGHEVPPAARYASLDAFLVEGLGRKGVEFVLQRSPWHRVQKRVMSRTSRAILESSGKGQVYHLGLKDRIGVEDQKRQESAQGVQAVLRDLNGGKGPGSIRKAVYSDGFLRRMQQEIDEEAKKSERARKVVSTERMESFISRMACDMSRRQKVAKRHESELLKAALQADAWSKGQGKKAGLLAYRQQRKKGE